MNIVKDKVVTLDYVLTDSDGTVLDRSSDGQFVYLHGAQNIIPGLETALDGKAVGDKFDVTVPAAEGYGERNDELSQVVEVTMFEEPDQVVVGQQFHASDETGQTIVITIVARDGDQVTIDGNHPLAGKDLNFDVTVIEIRDATAEEVDHGHVHMPGHEH